MGLISLMACSACVGNIGLPSGENAQDQSAEGDGVDPGTAPLRRLTHAQYDATTADLLGTVLTFASSFPLEGAINGFNNQAEAQTASLLNVQQYGSAAEAIAAEAVGSPEKRAALVPCTPSSETAADAACMETFVRAFALRAFRRAPSEEQVADLTGRGVAEASAAGNFWEGVSLVVEIALQSASFLYHIENGVENDERPDLYRLDDYSMANRLAYLLWNRMPDVELMDAAARGEVHTAEQVSSHAERLINDPHATASAKDFFAQWFGYRDALEAFKDEELFPTFTPELAASMVQETEMFVDHLVWEADTNIFEFLTADYSFVNGDLAALYGIGGVSGEDFVQVTLPPERRGLLGQASFLSANARPNTTSPVHRGKFVRENILCEELPPPPPGVNFAAVDEPTAGPTTVRQRLESHVQESCSSCHKLMDPIGFGLENFDSMGAYRTEEAWYPEPDGRSTTPEEPTMLPIDASGHIEGMENSDFVGLSGMTAFLFESETLKDCMMRQVFRWSHGRKEEASDAATLENYQVEFSEQGYRFKELLFTLATSDAMRFVHPPEL